MILRGNVYSQNLEMNNQITIIVPNSFKKNNKYKVAYLLHGIHGDSDSWLDNTMLPIYAREKNIVFVMPSVNRSFYCDTKSGQKFFSYVADELPRITQSVFNVTSERDKTAVIGASMGGYGAFKIGMSRPEKFGFVGAFSSAILPIKDYLDANRTEEQKQKQREIWGSQMVDDMLAIFGEDLRYDPDDDILELAKCVEKSKYNPKIYMACGYDDYLYEDNKMFQEKMKELKLDFTYEEWEGEHDWFFFDEALEKSIDYFNGFSG